MVKPTPMIDVLLSPTPLSIDAAYGKVTDPACGGIALFVGTIRNHNRGREVVRLHFESYEPMALREMTALAEELTVAHDLAHVAVHHRTGDLAIGEVAVVIAVSSAHRAAAFAGCSAIIDALKKRVPIWKREYLTDGSYWVNARP